MATSISMDIRAGDYGKILNAASWMAAHRRMTAVSALALMVEASPLYKEILAEMAAAENGGKS